MLANVKSSAWDPFNFETDPDPGFALNPYPDPGYFFKIYWFFLTKQKFQIFCLIFSLIFMQNFKNSEIREILYPFFFEFKFELLV